MWGIPAALCWCLRIPSQQQNTAAHASSESPIDSPEVGGNVGYM
jgi:hypothetical protein